MAALHLELPQGSRRSISAGDLLGAGLIHGRHKLCETQPIKSLGLEGYTKLNRSQFLRLSRKLAESPYNLRGTKWQVLKDICLVANFSEEFFLSLSKDQWLRTAIICDTKNPNALFSAADVKIKDFGSSSLLAVSITIHSKVVPYWPKLHIARDEAPEVASKELYFPSTFLDVAISEKKSLREQLDEWEEEQQHEGDDDNKGDQPKDGTPFWNVESRDMVIMKKDVAEGNLAAVGTILWRGGIFARKVFKLKEEFYGELEVVQRVSHPHIVYTFGLSISTDEKRQQHGEEQHSLLMELLDCDLYCLIRDRVRLEGRSGPPFSRRDSVHVLLQIAKAMAYIHDLAEPVIHGDLKSENVLVSKCGILGDVCQYFVKVADFGSAKILNPSSPFRASGGTTKYAAPEVLEARDRARSKEALARIKEDLEISCPQKLDVYSFGIVAFEVLTGLKPYKKSPSVLVSKEGVAGLVPYEGVASPPEFKKGVIAGTLRPPLQEACSRPNFWSDRPDLISLVESCWHPEPAARPHFSDVANRLEGIYNELNQEPTNGSMASSSSSQAHQECHLSVQEKPREVSRLKAVSEHLLHLTCMSSGKTIE